MEMVAPFLEDNTEKTVLDSFKDRRTIINIQPIKVRVVTRDQV